MPWLSEVMEELVEEIGIRQSVISDRARDVWKEAVGDLINSNTTLEKIERDKIIVIVSNDTWRKELSERKKEIITKINDLIGENAIKDIIFR
ncbi:MAG: DUF721 domain-containing protein [Candidatus Marinimicrobia bacterium]|nr:DUF721 domain-containing protein [Candidatus Neomarinimicrobiota bacterium]